MKYKGYIVTSNKCKHYECFVPFEGNGTKTCRILEISGCPKDPILKKKK